MERITNALLAARHYREIYWGTLSDIKNYVLTRFKRSVVDIMLYPSGDSKTILIFVELTAWDTMIPWRRAWIKYALNKAAIKRAMVGAGEKHKFIVF